MKRFQSHREIPSKRHCPYCCNGPSLGRPFVRGCVVRSAADLGFFCHCPMKELICFSPSLLRSWFKPSSSPFPGLSGISLFCSHPLTETEATNPPNPGTGISLQKRSCPSPGPFGQFQLSKLRRTAAAPWLLWGSSRAAPPRGGDAFSLHAAGSTDTRVENVGSWVTWGSCRVRVTG